jgi:hypothetical protein
MKTPVRSSRGQLQYTGRIAREAFAEWADSAEGNAATARLAARTGFAFFGKMRAARQQMWRELTAAARGDSVAAAVQREIDAHLARLDTFVFADGLPAVMVDLRRLIVVPRLLVHGESYRRLELALHVQPAIGGLAGGESLRKWLSVMLVDSIAAAVNDAGPSIRHPLPAGDGWIVIGVDEQFEWQIPFDGPTWHGHYFVLELTRRPLTRAVRTAAADGLAQLQTGLPTLSYVHRTEVIRQAVQSLDVLFGAKSKRRTLSRPA